MGFRLSATDNEGKLESKERQTDTLLVLVFSFDSFIVRNMG